MKATTGAAVDRLAISEPIQNRHDCRIMEGREGTKFLLRNTGIIAVLRTRIIGLTVIIIFVTQNNIRHIRVK